MGNQMETRCIHLFQISVLIVLQIKRNSSCVLKISEFRKVHCLNLVVCATVRHKGRCQKSNAFDWIWCLGI